jgi:hypothetical protein
MIRLIGKYLNSIIDLALWCSSNLSILTQSEKSRPSVQIRKIARSDLIDPPVHWIQLKILIQSFFFLPNATERLIG